MVKKLSEIEHAGVIGRTLRLLLGLLLCWMTFIALRLEDPGFHLITLGAFLGLTGLYSVVLLLVGKKLPTLHSWLGSLLVLVPFIAVFFFGGLFARVASTAYLGISLVLQSLRGDIRAEVLLLPSILLNRPTHLLAALFAPIDWIEARLSGPGGMPA